MFSGGDSLVSFRDPKLAIAERFIRDQGEAFERIRRESLYVWRDESWARRTWELGLSERPKFLYKLCVQIDDVQHLGDVSFISEIRDTLDEGGNADALRTRYWEGSASKGQLKERVEILVRKATVLERIEPSR